MIRPLRAEREALLETVTGEDPARAPSYLGCALAYWTRGDGRPVLFIQGTGLHGNGWLPQIEALEEDHACLWFDNRGIGLSRPTGGAAGADFTGQQWSLGCPVVRSVSRAEWPGRPGWGSHV